MKKQCNSLSNNGQDLDQERMFYSKFDFSECIDSPYWVEVFEHFSRVTGGRISVLDICCGDGTWDFFIVRKGYKVYGIDLSQEMMETRRKLFRKYGLNAKGRIGNAASLQIDDASYPIVTIISGLHHFPNPNPVLEEAARVCSDDGVFFVWEPNLFNPLVHLDYFWGLKIKHESRFSENEYPMNPLTLRKRLKAYFKDVNIYSIRVLPKIRGCLSADRIISKIPVINLFGGVIVAVARNPIRN